MLQSTISAFLAPVGRTAMGLIFALVLAFLGDVAARVFNLSIGYPWTQSVHQNIHFISIGVGAGIGSYLGWMNLERHWYFILGLGTLVLVGGIAGAYLGRFYGPGAATGYWWSRFATDSTIHLVAAALSTGVATALGLADLMYTRTRLKARGKPFSPGDWSLTRPPNPN
jgi:hypothetical protein